MSDEYEGNDVSNKYESAYVIENPNTSPVRRSASIAKLAEALAKASSEFEEISKDTTNPFYKSKYADLAALIKATRPYLAKNGLIVTQFPLMNGTRAGATTMIAHSSGEWMEGDLTLPIAKADAQGAGSAITYSKRYSYQGVLNVAGDDDDDGNAASGKKPKDIAEAEGAFAEKSGGKAPANLIAAFDAMFKRSGKTPEQLATILRTRWSAGAPADLTRDELGELVKWAASKEPLQQTLETSVKAAIAGPETGVQGASKLIPDPEAAKPHERIACRVNELVWKQQRPPKKGTYAILEIFDDNHPKNYDIYSFDAKVNEVLAKENVRTKLCIFNIQPDPKYPKLAGIEEISGIRYKNNQPVLDYDAVMTPPASS